VAVHGKGVRGRPYNLSDLIMSILKINQTPFKLTVRTRNRFTPLT